MSYMVFQPSYLASVGPTGVIRFADFSTRLTPTATASSTTGSLQIGFAANPVASGSVGSREG